MVCAGPRVWVVLRGASPPHGYFLVHGHGCRCSSPVVLNYDYKMGPSSNHQGTLKNNVVYSQVLYIARKEGGTQRGQYWLDIHLGLN